MVAFAQFIRQLQCELQAIVWLVSNQQLRDVTLVVHDRFDFNFAQKYDPEPCRKGGLLEASSISVSVNVR